MVRSLPLLRSTQRVDAQPQDDQNNYDHRSSNLRPAPHNGLDEEGAKMFQAAPLQERLLGSLVSMRFCGNRRGWSCQQDLVLMRGQLIPVPLSLAD